MRISTTGLTKVHLKINFKYMTKIIGLKELRNDMEKYIDRVKKGEDFVVVKRSRPVFKMSSPNEDEGGWETVVDFTQVDKKGVDINSVLKKL